MLRFDIVLQIYSFILKPEQKFCNFAAMMKKILFMAVLLMMSLMAGCDQQGHGGLQDYTVTCTLDGKLQHDSATLLVLEEDYNKLRVCGTARAHEGSFTFKGQIERPRAALIRWDNDSVNIFHFVLEAGDIKLIIKPEAWSVAGSALNAEYQQFINRRNAIMSARVTTWQEYLKAAADSTLKREDEQRMVQQDSLLYDSLQRITVQRINLGGPVGHLVRERFAGQLDQEHARQLK